MLRNVALMTPQARYRPPQSPAFSPPWGAFELPYIGYAYGVQNPAWQSDFVSAQNRGPPAYAMARYGPHARGTYLRPPAYY